MAGNINAVHFLFPTISNNNMADVRIRSQYKCHVITGRQMNF